MSREVAQRVLLHDSRDRAASRLTLEHGDPPTCQLTAGRFVSSRS